MNDEIIYIMTPEDLTKALKCISGEEEIFCKDCAFSHYGAGFACKKNVAKVALYFLNRHRAAIERKDGIIKSYAFQRGTATDKEVVARAKAIMEFAERLKIDFGHGVLGMNSVAAIIDNLVKEMTEETP